MGINKVFLAGHVGQNPELRYTQGGQPVMNIRMATNDGYVKDGEFVERTEWHTVVVWGKRAEGLSKFLEKGSFITVEGRLQTRSWEDREGTKRFVTEIVANDIVVPGRKQTGAEQKAGEPESPPPPSGEDLPF